MAKRISDSNRRALARTILLSIATIVIAGLFLLSLLRDLDRANDQLKVARTDAATAIAARDKALADQKTATDALAAAEAALKPSQDALTEAQAALKAETDKTASLQGTVDTLQAQIAAMKKPPESGGRRHHQETEAGASGSNQGALSTIDLIATHLVVIASRLLAVWQSRVTRPASVAPPWIAASLRFSQ